MIASDSYGGCCLYLEMHAEPIAALAALKLVSLALHSTNSSAIGFAPERRETSLIATHGSRSL